MTNDPLDPVEGPLWENGTAPDGSSLRDVRFHPVLRLDRILNKWPDHWSVLESKGYAVDRNATGESVSEVRRFLTDWLRRMKPVYMAVSLPDTFAFPEESIRGKLLSGAVLPACGEAGIPLSLMLGVRYQVNPRLRAGRRWLWKSRPSRHRESLRGLPRKSLSGERAEPRKSARAVRLRPQIREPHAFWMLVVPE